MANNRKRLIARTLRREILSDQELLGHWEWVEMTAPSSYQNYARTWQDILFGRMERHLRKLWDYRITPKQLCLKSWQRDELENWDGWYEYLRGIPANQTQAESAWSQRLYGEDK